MPNQTTQTPERDALTEIRDLHSDVHQCLGGWWWNPQRKSGASIANQGPCPTLTHALAGLGQESSDIAPPGTSFTHENGRVCVRQRLGGWGINVEAPEFGGPAKGFCALSHEPAATRDARAHAADGSVSP